MKRHTAPRIVAMLLALAMLAMTAALAEVAVTEDGTVGNGGGAVVEDAGLELSDLPVDISLEDSIPELPTGLIGVEALDGIGLKSDDLADLVEMTDDDPQIVLGVKEKYTLDAEEIGGGKKVTFKSSRKSVASVTSKGVIKGVKKGSAKITCKVGSKTKAVYEVEVVSAPGEVTLDKSSVTLGVKESVTLTPTIPEGTHASFTWSSKDKSVATVTKAGKITGKKAGKTTVTVKTHNGKTAQVTVRVKKAPGKVTLNKSSATMNTGDSLQLKATLPSNTYSKITWSSSDKTVAKVSASGKVTAVAVGTATITAKTFNDRKATCKVTVESSAGGETTYRALLIGEEHFTDDTCVRNRGDVLLMSDMLKTVKGLYGGRFSITKRYDLSGRQVLNAISDTFSDADDDDVSLFFIATHGDMTTDPDYAGALAMTPSGELPLSDLADALKAVPGKVIVILESCGAGAAVYANNGSKDKKALFEEAKKRTEAFDAAVIRAFSKADTGVEVVLRANELDSSGVRANTGEFREENKFYVLTASRYQELSWGYESGQVETSHNFFTLWLTEGIGTFGPMLADANDNGQTTLNELYRYISEVGDDYAFRDSSGRVYYQHVQVYPAKCSFVLFCR